MRASRKATHEEHLLPTLAANRLKMALNEYLWRDANHIDLKTLWSYLTKYLYLPRLKNEQVLVQLVQENINSLLQLENFAYTTGWDEVSQRYLGLATPGNTIVSISSQNLLVKPEIARKQLEEGESARREATELQAGESRTASPKAKESTSTTRTTVTKVGSQETASSETSPPKLRRFYGSVQIDPVRLTRDAGQIANEVIQHLSSLNADVQVTLDIQVHVPDGVPDHVVHTITENCRVLRFISYDFEEEQPEVLAIY